MILAAYLLAIALTVAYLAGLILAAPEMGWVVEEDAFARPLTDDAQRSGRVSMTETAEPRVLKGNSPVSQTTLEEP